MKRAIACISVFVLGLAGFGAPMLARAAEFGITNPLRPEISSIPAFFNAVLSAITIIGIPVAAAFVVYAGFKFVFAMGSDTKLTDAKKTLSYTLIGVALFLGAVVIMNVIKATVTSLGAGIVPGV